MKVEERLCLFLKLNQEKFLDEWEKNIFISFEDSYFEEIRRNGEKMFQLVLYFIQFDYNEDHIKELANKVANERVKANVNIADFIYNVNIGRSEIFKHLNESQISLLELQPTINKINFCFDQFIYFAVQKYTELKDIVIEEKDTLLQQTHGERLTILGQMATSFVHEFRNPLTSVKGFIKLLQNDYPSVPYMDVITNELEQLTYKISQFLLFSKKEIIEKQKEQISLKELVEEVESFLYPTLVDSGVFLAVEMDSSITFGGYRDEIRQVLLNLLINAIDELKLVNKERRIFVTATQNRNELVISVKNNGPVIPKNILQSIFEPFFTRKDFGTGIGLFVCKQIVEKHSGTIHCHSSDECTVFSLHIPLNELKIHQPPFIDYKISM